jgi:hypothetical protein
MITDFKIFETLECNVDYIIGMPSGQVIDIRRSDINYLKQGGFIRFDQELKSYLFDDDDYNMILWKISKNHPKDIETPEETYVKFSDYIERQFHKKDNDKNSKYEKYLSKVFDFIGKQKNITGYKIDPTGGLIVFGSIIVENKKLIHLPVKFKEVTGDFTFKMCELESLEGCPDNVGGNFNVSFNALETLEGGPSYVGKNYNCSYNFLKNFEGSPKVILGNFTVNHNELKSIKGFPLEVQGILDISYNKNNYSLNFSNSKLMRGCIR